MIRKLLIANRGEIAVRVIRACRELGIGTVAIYSEADRDSLHVRLADEAVCVGPALASRSYLNTPNVVSAALITGCDAVHPGYGFLSENPYFAEICERCDLIFVGPPASVLDKLSNKAATRALLSKSGLPVLPGSSAPLKSPAEARDLADSIGYPVILKAALGGGGRGLRIVHHDRDLAQVFGVAQVEAEKSFGNGDLYLEKYLDRPRHVEIQVLIDRQGHGVYLGERDCSLQRRYQKIMEEAPSPAVNPNLRKKMGQVSLKALANAGYSSAATVEFLLDKDGRFYFMEVNKRIQVEHPVTEMIYGVDLVKWQLRIASGEKLTLKQDELRPGGHAIECRINAEDPTAQFQPSSGQVQQVWWPGGPGVRVDTHVYSGYVAPPYYDSLLAKLIVWGDNRGEALERMRRCLDELQVDGVPTTAAFLRQLLADERVVRGEVYTRFIEDEFVKGGLVTRDGP